MSVFLKLGGSLITDKATSEAARHSVIESLAQQIARARETLPEIQLLIGHGSGSFGHHTASEYGTRDGVSDQRGWYGFAKVGTVAARLSQIVLDCLDAAGVPVLRFPPSASAHCRDGQIISMATEPIATALDNGLVPLVYGDVALDEQRGGTIVSTEEVFAFLAERLHPTRILLAGDYEGVLDEHGNVIPHIHAANHHSFRGTLGSAANPDVTGGMAAKVSEMLALCDRLPGLHVHIFDGSRAEAVYTALTTDHLASGTLITAG
jgi:isopentenyl phosphate kinase